MCRGRATRNGLHTNALGGRWPLSTLLALVILAATPGRLHAQDSAGVTADDMIAGMARQADMLAEYRCRYTLTLRSLYKPVYDETAPAGSNEANRVERYTAMSTEEIAAVQEVRTYSYVVKGVKFAYEVKVESGRPHLSPAERSFVERHAFDGTRHLDLSNYGGEDYYGAVQLPNARLSPVNWRPEYFFRYCESTPVTAALRADPVVIRQGMEKILGKDCYVVDCGSRQGAPAFTLYVCPDYDFLTLRMMRNFSRGEGMYTKYEITEVAEVEDGLWFPVRATRESYQNNPEDKAESLKIYSVEYQLDLASLSVNAGNVRHTELIPR